MEPQTFDLVAIGDTTADAFIRLSANENANCHVNQETREICLRFGEKIPYESATVIPAVGNSANAAVCAARLGLRAALVSDLGNDYHGNEALGSLATNQVDARWVTKHDGLLTNYHYVLWYQDDRTILVKHERYPYKLPLDFSQAKPPTWIYLSSLGENSLPYHHELANYLQAHTEVKLAFQPGTYQIKFGASELKEIYERTEIFFCNVGEATRILPARHATQGVAGGQMETIKNLLISINKLGPKIVVITDATRGAYVYYDQKVFFMPPYPDPKPPLERTGAGDAFASTFVAALALGKTVNEALAWAPINSMSVVQEIGAQKGLLTREQLEKYLAAAPADYQAREI